ncbi:MAG: RluA family pseudouridine synthase [Tepidisphaeraceae bacterium]
MLVAKSDEAHWRLARQFELRTIQKTYMALVHGTPALLADVIDAPIGRDKFIREKMAVRKIESGAKEAVTKYEVMEQIGTRPDALTPPPMSTATSGQYALLRLSPKTGRTHQLRVHCTHMGHPIVGDIIYGGKAIASADGSFKFERQALHAYQISFTHPITLKGMTLEAPLPADIRAAIDLVKTGQALTQ